MSFSTSPLSGSNIISPPGAQSQAQKTARERAISMLEGKNQQQGTQTTRSAPSAPMQSQVSPQEAQALQSVGLDQSHLSESPAQVSTEVPVEQPKVAEKDPLSAHYARLARNEKLLRAKVAEQKAREDALNRRDEEFKARDLEYQQKYISKDLLKSDPLSVLSEQGLTYDQLTQMAINAPSPESREAEARYKALEAKIAELTKGQEDTKKSYQEQQDAAYKQALNQIRQDTRDLVRMQPDEFEAIKATNSVGDVVDLIERTWKRDNILLSVEEATREVENYLVEEATKLSRLKKIQQKLAAQAAPAKAPEAPKSGQSSLKTLTNTVGSTRQLSARERAMLAFKGELK